MHGVSADNRRLPFERGVWQLPTPMGLFWFLKSFNLDFAKRYPPGMGLQSDKARCTSRARLTSRRVRIIVFGDFYAIEEHDVMLPLRMNLELIPLTHRLYRKVVRIARRGEAIDRAGFG